MQNQQDKQLGNSVFVFGIAKDSIVDGPGLRWALFVQGCPFHCKDCHNSESLAFSKNNPYTIESLFNEASKNKLAKGITFSGGEPLMQARELSKLAIQLRSIGKEIAIFTGFFWEEIYGKAALPERVLKNIEKSIPGFQENIKTELKIMQALVEQADTLIDGRFDIAEKDLRLRFKGSHNQRIIDVPRSLKSGDVVIRTEERWVPREH
jgi:anaerobic ribonucleoside-triphosphate reductase activating protein